MRKRSFWQSYWQKVQLFTLNLISQPIWIMVQVLQFGIDWQKKQQKQMGYYLYITRASHWYDNEGFEISAEEWLDIVKADSDLKLGGFNGPYFVIWADTGNELGGPWLNWKGGNIESKGPDDRTIEKMVTIAKQLRGRVQGDNLEIYLGGGQVKQPFLQPEPKPTKLEMIVRLSGFVIFCTVCGFIFIALAYGLFHMFSH